MKPSRMTPTRWRRRATAIAVAVSISGACLTLSAATPVAAASCPTMQVVGVRGSGETQNDYDGFGRTVRAVAQRIQDVVPGTTIHPIDYPAVGVLYGGLQYPAEYAKSISAGKISLSNYITDFLAGPCAKTTYLYLIGYSQGAQVIADVYETLGTAPRGRIGGVTLLGDPRFYGHQGDPVAVGTYNPKKNGVATSFGYKKNQIKETQKVRSYCVKDDPICNWADGAIGCKTNPDGCAHIHYPDLTLPQTSLTYTTLAGNFLISRWRTLGPPPPAIGPKSKVLIYGDNDPTDNDSSGMTNLVNALTGAGYQVSTSSTLPADLSPYGQVWHYGVLDVPDDAQVAQLVAFARNGGSLFLTGEWNGCCSSPSANDGVKNIFDRLVVTVGGLTFGPEGYDVLAVNPSAVASAAFTPNRLTTFTGVVAGTINPTNIGSANLLTRSDPTTTPGYGTIGLWDEFDVVGGGRLAIVMDVNWAQTTFGDMTTMPSVASNIAYFLSGNPATLVQQTDSKQRRTFVPASPGARSSVWTGPSSNRH